MDPRTPRNTNDPKSYNWIIIVGTIAIIAAVTYAIMNFGKAPTPETNMNTTVETIPATAPGQDSTPPATPQQ